jgi:hypothetical protein
LPAVVRQPERPAQTRRAGHFAVIGAGRALAKIEEGAGMQLLQAYLDYCVRPLLDEPWVLDVDTTFKPLYGHQEGAVVGYNSRKPGAVVALLSLLHAIGWSSGGAQRCFQRAYARKDSHPLSRAADLCVIRWRMPYPPRPPRKYPDLSPAEARAGALAPYRFQPGQSGNPEGISRSRREQMMACEAAALEKTPEAITTLVELMRHSEGDRVRARCAEIIIERGLGKPREALPSLEDENCGPRKFQIVFVRPGTPKPGLPLISNQAGYDQLPSGARFLGPDLRERVKP